MTANFWVETYKEDLIQASEQGIRKRGSSVNAMLKAIDIYADKICSFPSEHIEKAYVLSDIHFGHKNVLEYSGRPFNTIEEMNETIIKNIVEIDSPETHLIILGDCAMAKGFELSNSFFRSLDSKTYLVMGNHDLSGSGHIRVEGFDVVTPLMGMTVPGKETRLVLTHYPLCCVNISAMRMINVHGHEHQNNAHSNKHINVSVDQIDFTPVKLSDIYKLAKWEDSKKKIKEVQRKTKDRLMNI